MVLGITVHPRVHFKSQHINKSKIQIVWCDVASLLLVNYLGRCLVPPSCSLSMLKLIISINIVSTSTLLGKYRHYAGLRPRVLTLPPLCPHSTTIVPSALVPGSRTAWIALIFLLSFLLFFFEAVVGSQDKDCIWNKYWLYWNYFTTPEAQRY